MDRMHKFVFMQFAISVVVLLTCPWVKAIPIHESSAEEDLDTQMTMSFLKDAMDAQGVDMMDSFQKCVNKCIPIMQEHKPDDGSVTWSFNCHRKCMTNPHMFDGTSHSDSNPHDDTSEDRPGDVDSKGHEDDNNGKGSDHANGHISKPTFGTFGFF